MNILILEDGPRRIEWFKQNLDYDVLVTTDDPQVAISNIENQEFDVIYLDHDLLPEHYEQDTNCDKTTGLCVAKHLALTNKNYDATIIIHSRNWNGVGRMVAALVNGDRVVTCHPFHIMSGLKI